MSRCYVVRVVVHQMTVPTEKLQCRGSPPHTIGILVVVHIKVVAHAQRHKQVKGRKVQHAREERISIT